jgi:hypothetical protein
MLFIRRAAKHANATLPFPGATLPALFPTYAYTTLPPWRVALDRSISQTFCLASGRAGPGLALTAQPLRGRAGVTPRAGPAVQYGIESVGSTDDGVDVGVGVEDDHVWFGRLRVSVL